MSKARTRPTRLGRGLSSLMAQPVAVDLEPAEAAERALVGAPAAASDRPAAMPGPDQVVALPLDAITPNPHQPRQQFDPAALNALAESIRNDGLLQPVIVRPAASADSDSDVGPRYELIAGERRWRAAEMVGLARLPAIVRDVDDRQAVAWALIENLQRQDLNPIERALGFRDLSQRFDLSHDEVAQRVGVERPTVSNSLRLLDLCSDVRRFVQDGLVSAGHGKALAGLADPAQQLLLAKRAVNQGWSVRRLEAAVRGLLAGSAAGEAGQDATAGPVRSAHLVDLEQQLTRQLGSKVHIRTGRKKGTGTVTIAFRSLDQFDQLLERLGVETT